MNLKSDTASLAPAPVLAPASSWTIEERLHRIDVMGKRIEGYIRFMCQVATQANVSAEAKDKAVAAFHDRLVIVEKQLARIQENFSLQ